MCNYCGADCSACSFKEGCKGCTETCGSPFGGRCVAAEYIKTGGKEAYNEFKAVLLSEINDELKRLGIPAAKALYELAGSFVNLEYELPGGQKVKFLDEKNIYLGCQIPLEDTGICFGAAADAGFILISRYSTDGSDPEIVMYRQR